jgi:hypothetical protein
MNDKSTRLTRINPKMKILQISDIHWTKRRHWEEDYPGMKSKYRDDIKEYIEAGNQIDYGRSS